VKQPAGSRTYWPEPVPMPGASWRILSSRGFAIPLISRRGIMLVRGRYLGQEGVVPLLSDDEQFPAELLLLRPRVFLAWQFGHNAII
jgi:hypothetical protein